MKKRMVSLLLTLCMALTLLPATASATDLPSELYVGDVNVIGGGYWVSDGNGGITAEGATAEKYNVAYDAAKRSITLRNAVITKCSWTNYGLTGGVTRGGMYAGIHTNGSIYIDLEGDNRIDLSGYAKIEGTCAGIAAGNDNQGITFRGSGNLTVQSGTATSNSFGLFIGLAVVMDGTGCVELLGGACGMDRISAGIYNQGEANDHTAYVKPRRGTLIAGTNYGGSASYGVYSKVELSESGFNHFDGNFTAYCGTGDIAVAMSMPPMYMPVGNSALMGSEYSSGEWYTAYRVEDNALYRYVTVAHNLGYGASVSGLQQQSTTPYTITMDEAVISDSNPGGQVVEYALGKAVNGNEPDIGWQLEPVFAGLAPGTTYAVYARTAATTGYAAGSTVKVFVTTDSDLYGSSVYTGLCVDGIAINKSVNLPETPIGDDPSGWMRYDSATRTLYFGGTVKITHGCTTLKTGQAAGIFSNGKLNIVLEDGAELNIEMKNYARDRELTTQQEKSYPISGQCFGILNQGDLTIDAAEGCTTAPQVNINVMGAGMAIGIRTVEFRDASSAVLEEGKLTIGAVDMDITVRGMSGPAFLNPQIVAQRQDGYGSVSGISSGDDIIVNGVNAADGVAGTSLTVQTVGGYQGHLFDAGATGYGEVILNGGYVSAENNARNGAYRVSYNVIKWADGYTCRNGMGFLVSMDDAMWIKGSAYFTPNSVETLTGTIELTVTGSDDGKLRVGSTITARLINSNAREEELTYEWYWDEVSPNRKSSQTGPSCTVDKSGAGHYLICRVTSAGRLGAIEKKSNMIEISLVPELYVDGVQLTKENYRQIIPAEKGIASYDFGTNTLTLENANLDTATSGGSGKAVIESNLELTILLKGSNNSVTLPEGDGHMAVYSKEKLTFTGDGTLNISTNYVTKGNSAAIGTVGDITIDGGCTVEVKSNNVVLKTESGNLTVSDGATLEVTSNAGKLYQAVLASAGTVTVSDGAKMTVNVKKTESGTSGTGCGIKTKSLVIRNNSTVEVNNIADTSLYDPYSTPAVYIGSGGELALLDGGTLEAHSQVGYGIYSYGKVDVQYGGYMVVSGGKRAIKTGGDGVIEITAPVSMVYADKDMITGENASRVANPTQYTYKSNKYIRVETKFAPQLTAALQDGVLAVTLSTDGGIGEAVLFAAHYDANGKLLAVKSMNVDAGTTTKSEVVPFDMTAGGSYQVFLLDANGAPLCAAVSKEIVY